MKILGLLALLGIASLRGQMVNHEFRMLEGNPKVIRAVIETISAGKYEGQEMGEKIDELVKSNKLKQNYYFKGDLKSGLKFTDLKKSGEILVPEIPMGITVDMDSASGNDMKVADNLYQLNFREKIGRHLFRLQKVTLNNSMMIGVNWEVVTYFESESSAKVILHFMKAPNKGNDLNFRVAVIEVEVELRSVGKEDITRFQKSTPATRNKAIAWLQGQGRTISRGMLKTRPGIFARYFDQVVQYEKNARWDRIERGTSVSVEAHLDKSDKAIHLDLKADWKSPEKGEEARNAIFEMKELKPSNESFVLLPVKTEGKNDQELIMIVTPEISFLGNKKP